MLTLSRPIFEDFLHAWWKIAIYQGLWGGLTELGKKCSVYNGGDNRGGKQTYRELPTTCLEDCKEGKRGRRNQKREKRGEWSGSEIPPGGEGRRGRRRGEAVEDKRQLYIRGIIGVLIGVPRRRKRPGFTRSFPHKQIVPGGYGAQQRFPIIPIRTAGTHRPSPARAG